METSAADYAYGQWKGPELIAAGRRRLSKRPRSRRATARRRATPRKGTAERECKSSDAAGGAKVGGLSDGGGPWAVSFPGGGPRKMRGRLGWLAEKRFLQRAASRPPPLSRLGARAQAIGRELPELCFWSPE